MMQQALDAADDLIEQLAAQGYDYSKHREAIAELWDGGVWSGNWDWTTDLEDPNLRDLRLIQEDHYDQHMDHDEDKPEWDDMVCDATDGYVWFV